MGFTLLSMGKHFGAKLASCMAVRGWVDDAVAQKLVSPKTGRAYHRSHIANLRNGKVEPSEMLVAQLERIFGGDDGAALRAAWVTEQTPPGAREALEAERKARVAAEAEVAQLRASGSGGPGSPRLPRESAVDMASRVGRYGSDAYYQAGLWIRPPRREDTEDCLFQAAVIVEALNIRNWRAALLKAVRAVIPPDALAAAEANLRTNLADQASARAAFEGEMLRSDIPVEEVTSREWVLLECRSPKCPHPGHRFWEDASGPVEAAHCPLNGDPETHPEVDLRAIARARFQPTSHAEGA